jgi:hypothetical protein
MDLADRQTDRQTGKRGPVCWEGFLVHRRRPRVLSCIAFCWSRLGRHQMSIVSTNRLGAAIHLKLFGLEGDVGGPWHLAPRYPHPMNLTFILDNECIG